VFDDVYFSRAGGLAETCHVFLEQNRLPARLGELTGQGFTIAETGFGTGLNFFATLALWRRVRATPAQSGWLHFISTEKHPLQREDLQRAHAMWPQFADLSALLLAEYPPLVPGFHRILFAGEKLTLTLLFGDATTQLRKLDARVDAWFLDGFAPARNDSLWSPALFGEIARLSHGGTTLATYTAAGEVRRGLQAAGFAMEKVPGFGSKRDMLRGSFPGSKASRIPKPWLTRSQGSGPKQATVIGAGIAGASVAHALALRGYSVDVYEAGHGPAGAASGNPAAMVYPHIAAPASADESFSQQAFLFALQYFRSLPPGIWNPCGLLWLLRGKQARAAKNLTDHPWPETLLQSLDAEAASIIAGAPVSVPALYFPDGGYLQAPALCAHLLDHGHIRAHYGTRIEQLRATENSWQLLTDNGQQFSAPILILANAAAARALPQTEQLPLQSVRGQIAMAASSAMSGSLRCVICHGGYISPAMAGRHCLGASFYPDRNDTEVLPAEQEEIRAMLHEALPDLADSLPPTTQWQGRAALRCQSPDYLPLAGPIPDYENFIRDFGGLRDGNTRGLQEARLLPGLYCSLAHGSQGFTQALLAAEILAAEINAEPCPVPRSVSESLHPARFWVRQLRRRQI
jgi:tRNA 5-methylaminomethyl-2-thiouridine biosynthesis bifunctional protein